jgi:C-mannosyltransferase DPY19L
MLSSSVGSALLPGMDFSIEDVFSLETLLGLFFALYLQNVILCYCPLFQLSFCLSVAILFGNSVLLNSLYLSSLLSILGLLLLRDLLQRVQFRPLFLLLHLFFHLASTLAIKMFFQRIFGLNDDNNVNSLL